jgi:hypothetical protein
MNAPVQRAGRPGDEHHRSALWFERGCLAVIALIALVTVVLPLLIWAAAIIFAGSRT